ncbi:hypothetical protein ACTJJ7_11840 [Phyllobacterium sp. 22229]|uniref:Transmembrane protein n=1 Tax=Agrobacterium radiobacter TaxID=362 RepID=A0ABD5LN26_AGRRD
MIVPYAHPGLFRFDAYTLGKKMTLTKSKMGMASSMRDDEPVADHETPVEPPHNPAYRFAAGLVAFPFNILEAIGRAGFYGTWHLLFFVACAFRAFTSFLVLAGIVMLPVSLGVFIDPSTAPMPWWVFLLSALAMFAFAVGYNVFLDWFTPPGEEDPFDRYRPSLKRKS